jgi:NAD(P)-dependent dehydrogenase (short-subunit alcohol dehydrogenase family)
MDMVREDAEAIRGKVVLITGSGRGLGATLARACADRRARVVINCRSNEKAADALAVDVQKAGGEVLVCRADVTRWDEARGLVDETLRAFGRIDVLVNSVGAFSWKPLTDLDPDEWRMVMASNIDSVYHMCRLVLPHMRKSHWGRIVNLGAVGAERAMGQPKVSAYSAAKAAVIAFSRALALEEARCGITVNVIAPGVLLDDGARVVPSDAAGGLLGDRVPVGRAGSPEDVVRAVLFFVSPAADFLTGQVLAVAGGWGL